MLKQVIDPLLAFATDDKEPSFRELAARAGLDPANDFIGASLCNLDLRDEDLRGFNFSNADLRGVDFRRANLTGVPLRGANLTGAIGLADISTTRPGKKGSRKSESIFLNELPALDIEEPDVQSDSWNALVDAGNRQASLGNLETALKLYREGLAIADRSSISTSAHDRAEFRRKLSTSYEQMADLLRALGQEEEAQQATRKSIEIKEQQARNNNSDEADGPHVLQGKVISTSASPGGQLTVLRKHPYFADLEPDAFDQLCRYAKYTTLKRGATIASKGDPGTSLFAIISGTVKISVSSPDGRNAILNLIGPGEIFGEVAVLDGQSRTADVIANSNCELFIIDRRDFIPFVRSHPALAMKLIELLCERLRWTSDQVEQVILLDLPGRLASALLRLTEKHRTARGGRTVDVTQQEISEMVGMTRESINKQLRAWAARDWIRLEHGAIVVSKPRELQKLIHAQSERD